MTKVAIAGIVAGAISLPLSIALIIQALPNAQLGRVTSAVADKQPITVEINCGSFFGQCPDQIPMPNSSYQGQPTQPAQYQPVDPYQPSY